jgi:hypothetical protein
MNQMHMCVLLQIHTLGTYQPRCARGDKSNRAYSVGLVALVSGWGGYMPRGRKRQALIHDDDVFYLFVQKQKSARRYITYWYLPL